MLKPFELCEQGRRDHDCQQLSVLAADGYPRESTKIGDVGVGRRPVPADLAILQALATATDHGIGISGSHRILEGFKQFDYPVRQVAFDLTCPQPGVRAIRESDQPVCENINSLGAS